jgi:two-component system phosphate regulon sensor histidine kinase PhoR
LAISQLGSRKMSFHFEQVDLLESMNRVLERLDSRIRDTGASVTINTPKYLPQIEADAFRIEQALYNLVDNALKHSGTSAVKVTLEVRSDGHSVSILVHDDGVGIPLSDQPHIFERFYRVHKDRSRDAGGTGLGLSIVKHTVQAHGGSVSVQSNPGSGATFFMNLPIQQS